MFQHSPRSIVTNRGAPASLHLRENFAQQTYAIHKAKNGSGAWLLEEPQQFLADALRGNRLQARAMLLDPRQRTAIDFELELRRKAECPKGPQGIFCKGSPGESPDFLVSEVAPTIERIDDLAIRKGARHGVDRKITPAKIFLDRLSLQLGEIERYCGLTRCFPAPSP